jgi:glycosyltransferase involved in cell wall biosynthesis
MTQLRYCFLTTGDVSRNPSIVRAACLGRELTTLGLNVTYVVDDIPANRESNRFSNPTRVHYVSKGSPATGLSSRRALLAQLSPTYVHTINPSVKAMLTLAGSAHAVVADYDELPSARANNLQLFLASAAAERWAATRAKLVLCCSRYLQAIWSDRYHKAAHYVPYAIDDIPTSHTSTRSLMPHAFVYVGNFSPHYDLDIVFNAFAILAKRGIHPRATFIGGGPDWERWKRFRDINGLVNIHLPGYLPEADVLNAVSNAHALLFPIRPSPVNLCRCPYKVLVYARSQRPVITSDVGGEVRNILGNNAVYVPPAAEHFARAIFALHQKQTLPPVGYSLEPHTWRRRARALLKLVEKRLLSTFPCTAD